MATEQQTTSKSLLMKMAKTRTIQFNGITELKTDRYLKLSNKGAHIETYEEVRRDQVPEKALKEIDPR